MPNYRRAWHQGGTYFFTINLLERYQNDLLTKHIDLLRQAVAKVKQNHPFIIHGWVVLPEHIHCLIELPQNDADYAMRIRLIKSYFSKSLPNTERCSLVRQKTASEAFGKDVIGSI